MLKTNNWLYKAILIFNLLCIAAGVIFGAQTAVNPEADIYLQLCSLCAMPAMLYAAYYMLIGYSKPAAKYYKLFIALFIFYDIVLLIAQALSHSTYLPLLLTGLTLVMLMMLLFKKDLGRRLSLTICTLNFLFCLGGVFTAKQSAPIQVTASAPYSGLLVGRAATGLLLACLLGIITYAKYVDKTSRGTR